VQVRQGGGGGTEDGSEGLRGYRDPGLVPTNRAQRGIERRLVEAEVEYPADESSSGTGYGMATAPVGELFAANPVLLGVESEA
jgi:hypothetical protein